MDGQNTPFLSPLPDGWPTIRGELAGGWYSRGVPHLISSLRRLQFLSQQQS
jgi:hypothetical protein